MLTKKQKQEYLKKDNELWRNSCKELNKDFTPITENRVCWELVDKRMNNPNEKIEEVEYDEEKLFKELFEDLPEIKRQEALLEDK